MDIEIIISTTQMSDNTRDDNKRYAVAVFNSVESAYPNARLTVRLTDECESKCIVDGDWSGEESRAVEDVYSEIWGQANY